MAQDDVDLLAINRGTVTAPAGCGKTQLIAKAIARHGEPKPILVLTHTNAGVVALRGRLDREGVPAKAYRLCTIDGWAMRLISTFPQRSGHSRTLLELANPATDYPSIRVVATNLLVAGHVNNILSASYARLIVDEYQDCSIRQHTLVNWALRSCRPACSATPCRPSLVLEATGWRVGRRSVHIFHWPANSAYHGDGSMRVPSRWDAGCLRSARSSFAAIDLRKAPAGVTWVHLDGTENHQKCVVAARTRASNDEGCVLIIGDSTNPGSHRQFASQTPGAVTVEAVDLKDLVSFARAFDLAASDALERVADFAQSVMTNVGAADLVQRVQSLARGSARKPPTSVEATALAFSQAPSYRGAVDVLVEMGQQAGVRTHRPPVLRGCIKALNLCNGPDGLSFHEAAIRMREQNRLSGRPLPRRAVGSTLLSKGLEADVAVILNPGVMNARNLYVAMTRGSRSVIICSPTPVLNPPL